MRRLGLLSALVPLLAGCASPPAGGQTCGAAALQEPVFVLERSGDDMTAALGRLAGGCLDESPSDPVLGRDQFLLQAHANGQPFVAVNDDGSLRVLAEDRVAITQTCDVYQDHPPSSGEPHGIFGVDVDASGDAWVTRFDVPSLIVLSTKSPSCPFVATVDLSDLAGNGNPRMNGILVQDGKAFVALELLPDDPLSDAATQPGAIAVIDVATLKRTGLIQLPGHNPVQRFVPTGSPSVFLMAMPGQHTDMPGQHGAVSEDDGIDSVDLAAGTAKQIISEKVLGGSVDNVVWASPTEAYAIVMGPEAANPTSVVEFDPTSGQVKRTLVPAPTDPNAQGFVFAGLALDGDSVLVADQTTGNPRIRVFPRDGGSERPSIPTKVLPPVSLVTLAP